MFHLSITALRMIKEGIRHDTLIKKEDIINQINAYGYQVFDIIVEFQVLFGGIEYINLSDSGMPSSLRINPLSIKLQ